MPSIVTVAGSGTAEAPTPKLPPKVGTRETISGIRERQDATTPPSYT